MSNTAFLLEHTVIMLGVLQNDIKFARCSATDMDMDIEKMKTDLKRALDNIYEEWEK